MVEATGTGHGRTLTETGRGATAKEARQNAVAALAWSIVSRISSDLTTRGLEAEGRYDKSVEQRITLSSDVLLKGVEYSKPREADDGQVEVDAVFTPKALRHTADFLRRKVSGPSEALDVAGLRAVIEHAELLDALLTSRLAETLPDRKTLRLAAAEAHETAQRRLNQGIVVFDGELTGAELSVDGQALPRAAEHFLPPGEHSFVASKAGHHTLRGRLRLAAGERKVVRLRFVREREAGGQVYVAGPPEHPFLRDEVESALARFGIRVTGPTGAGNAVFVRLHDDATRAGSHSKHRLGLFLEAYRADVMVTKVKASLNYYATPDTADYLLRTKAGKLVRKLVPALMKDLNSRRFYSDKPFDYRRLGR